MTIPASINHTALKPYFPPSLLPSHTPLFRVCVSELYLIGNVHHQVVIALLPVAVLKKGTGHSG